MLWLLQAALWKQGDGLTWTDDLPICYHPDSIGEEKVNYSSYVASVKHYGLATTYCAFDDDGYNLATRDIAEWGYDWYAVAANTVSQCGQFGRGACKATTRAAAFACVHTYWACRTAQLSRSSPARAPLSTMLGHYLMHHYAAEWGALSIIGSEVGENINSVQAHFAFNRGAARQFHSPWFIDFSDWNGGYYHNYKMNASTHQYDRGENGHSLSLRERVAYLTYQLRSRMNYSRHRFDWALPYDSTFGCEND
jgi:hypothetical protein